MTKEELAATLNGREYGEELTVEEEKQARASTLLVVFGASDDLCELRGVISDEVGCNNGGTVLIAEDGSLLTSEIEHDHTEVLERYGVMEYAKRIREKALKIEAIWCEKDTGYSWTYKTSAPHATFEIVEGKAKYCRGIVIGMNEVARLAA